jgi:hypothetical protein
MVLSDGSRQQTRLPAKDAGDGFYRGVPAPRYGRRVAAPSQSFAGKHDRRQWFLFGGARASWRNTSSRPPPAQRGRPKQPKFLRSYKELDKTCPKPFKKERTKQSKTIHSHRPILLSGC